MRITRKTTNRCKEIYKLHSLLMTMHPILVQDHFCCYYYYRRVFFLFSHRNHFKIGLIWFFLSLSCSNMYYCWVLFAKRAFMYLLSEFLRLDSFFSLSHSRSLSLWKILCCCLFLFSFDKSILFSTHCIKCGKIRIRMTKLCEAAVSFFQFGLFVPRTQTAVCR